MKAPLFLFMFIGMGGGIGVSRAYVCARRMGMDERGGLKYVILCHIRIGTLQSKTRVGCLFFVGMMRYCVAILSGR